MTVLEEPQASEIDRECGLAVMDLLSTRAAPGALNPATGDESFAAAAPGELHQYFSSKWHK